jgi:hypothetical protein
MGGPPFILATLGAFTLHPRTRQDGGTAHPAAFRPRITSVRPVLRGRAHTGTRAAAGDRGGTTGPQRKPRAHGTGHTRGGLSHRMKISAASSRTVWSCARPRAHGAPGPPELCVPQVCLGEAPGRPRVAGEHGGVCGGLESRCFPCIEKLRTTPTVSVWNSASATTGVKPSAGAGVDTVHSHTPRKVREDTERAAGHDGGPSFWPPVDLGQGAFSELKSETTTRPFRLFFEAIWGSFRP